MIVVASFCHKDADLMLLNARWMQHLRNAPHHECVMLCNLQARDEGLHPPVHEALLKTFAKVHVAFCTEDERLWPEEQRKWPWAQNLSFTSAARYMAKVLRQPWLFLEADAIPLRDGWMDELEGEYLYHQKPFMGMLVATRAPDGNPIPAHMSGIGIYPADVSRWTDRALQGGGTAFDMVLAEATVLNMHDTPLIHHCYQSPPFHSEDDLARIRPGAAIYHQDKIGSLLRVLARRKGVEIEPKAKSPVTMITEPNSSLTTDIFIKTYPKDYEWLRYCIESINRFASGFRQVIVVAPDREWANASPKITCAAHSTLTEPDREPGYLWQQSVKLHADRYSDADQFLYMDSDTIFTRPVTPETFMRNGKAVWLKRPMAAAGSGRAWEECMRRFMGSTPKWETMCRHPFLFPRWFLNEVRNFCTFMHGVSLEDYIMQSGEFSEFNCAGALALARFQDRFHWIDYTRDEVPATTCLQHHSHDGISEEVREKLEGIVGVTTKSEDWKSNVLDAPNPATHRTKETPVDNAIAALKAEASRSPLHKARLVAKLVSAGIVAPRPKRRK